MGVILFVFRSLLTCRSLCVFSNSSWSCAIIAAASALNQRRHLLEVLSLLFCIIKLNFEAKMLNSTSKTIWDKPGVIPHMIARKVCVKLVLKQYSLIFRYPSKSSIWLATLEVNTEGLLQPCPESKLYLLRGLLQVLLPILRRQELPNLDNIQFTKPHQGAYLNLSKRNRLVWFLSVHEIPVQINMVRCCYL